MLKILNGFRRHVSARIMDAFTRLSRERARGREAMHVTPAALKYCEPNESLPKYLHSVHFLDVSSIPKSRAKYYGDDHKHLTTVSYISSEYHQMIIIDILTNNLAVVYML